MKKTYKFYRKMLVVLGIVERISSHDYKNNSGNILEDFKNFYNNLDSLLRNAKVIRLDKHTDDKIILSKNVRNSIKSKRQIERKSRLDLVPFEEMKTAIQIASSTCNRGKYLKFIKGGIRYIWENGCKNA